MLGLLSLSLPTQSGEGGGTPQTDGAGVILGQRQMRRQITAALARETWQPRCIQCFCNAAHNQDNCPSHSQHCPTAMYEKDSQPIHTMNDYQISAVAPLHFAYDSHKNFSIHCTLHPADSSGVYTTEHAAHVRRGAPGGGPESRQQCGAAAGAHRWPCGGGNVRAAWQCTTAPWPAAALSVRYSASAERPRTRPSAAHIIPIRKFYTVQCVVLHNHLTPADEM